MQGGEIVGAEFEPPRQLYHARDDKVKRIRGLMKMKQRERNLETFGYPLGAGDVS